MIAWIAVASSTAPTIQRQFFRLLLDEDVVDQELG